MKGSSGRCACLVLGLALVTSLTASGCAGKSGKSPQAPLLDTGSSADIGVKPASSGLAPPSGNESSTIASPKILVAQSGQATVSAKERQPDELFDPFAEADEAGAEEYDPWEPFNTTMFEFNRQVDRFVLKPVAKGYNFIMPDLVQVGISNIFYNLRFPPRLFNNLFQGKLRGAGIEVGRFLINSTVGLGGFLDVAKDVDLLTPEEDLGQTLGFYGLKPGPYLVLPFMQPFTVRDLIGYVGDVFLNPINWLVVPIIEVDGIPSVIAHKNRTTSSFVQIGARVGEIVNDRSRNLEKFQGVEEATLDLYSAVRNAYLQKRALSIKE